jgi:hypothetical protein
VIERSPIVAAKMAFVESAARGHLVADVIYHLENKTPSRVWAFLSAGSRLQNIPMLFGVAPTKPDRT